MLIAVCKGQPQQFRLTLSFLKFNAAPLTAYELRDSKSKCSHWVGATTTARWTNRTTLAELKKPVRKNHRRTYQSARTARLLWKTRSVQMAWWDEVVSGVRSGSKFMHRAWPQGRTPSTTVSTRARHHFSGRFRGSVRIRSKELARFPRAEGTPFNKFLRLSSSPY